MILFFSFGTLRKTACHVYKLFDEMLQWEWYFFSGVEFVARFFLRSKSLATILKGWSLFTQTSTNALKPLVTSVTHQRFSFTETEKKLTRCLELVKRGSVIVFGFTPENHHVFMKKINYEICNFCKQYFIISLRRIIFRHNRLSCYIIKNWIQREKNSWDWTDFSVNLGLV